MVILKMTIFVVGGFQGGFPTHFNTKKDESQISALKPTVIGAFNRTFVSDQMN